MLNLRRGIGTHEPSVISLGQVWVDIMLDVDEIPEQGGFAVADHPKPTIGGSYRVLQAASRMGVPTEHAGILGNGLWAHFIRQSFQDNGITHIGQDRLDEDSGFRVVLTSGSPKKTFIASYGAEAHGDADTFSTLEPQAKDVVHQRQHADGPHSHRRGRIPAEGRHRSRQARLHAGHQPHQYAAPGQ